ncbi:hypothetical protein Asp14428_07970 [Actinoplanes sp. NBRC 14428]|uniref:Universal stress protein family protein n=1 Tax=Pseudosporangium ferrugineum TaxID=439699 RepID=A0A2T0RKF2_9ACTN|nr:universal stress protein [Pseudosporangium ferrugineum]PRY21602.1 universal stress protein family protein [Pseudosporangium ferrugineum]BCJ49322.1 hypothetical protein Asp14428_07970 [Actinoplanes sp. NBRC 14428]
MSSTTLVRQFDVRPALSVPGLPALVVRRTGFTPGAGPVIVAVDADGQAAGLLRYGRTVAAELGVALRVVYVWTACRPPHCPGHRSCHDTLGDAERLLNGLLDRHLPLGAGVDVEREVLRSTEAAPALEALSRHAGLLVVGSSSDLPAPGRSLGSTTRALLRRAGCPLAVIPYRASGATRSGW